MKTRHRGRLGEAVLGLSTGVMLGVGANHIALGPMFGVLGAIWLLLVVGGSACNLLGLIETPLGRLFNLDGEQSVYEWFTQLLLAGSGVLLALRGARREDPSAWRRTQWFILSGLMFFASLDETVSIHEHAGILVDVALRASRAHNYLWVVPYGLFVLVGLIVAIPFFRDLPRRTALLFSLAAAAYLFGVIGLELVGGWLLSLDGADTRLAYWAAQTFEEGFEGLGALIFLYALLAGLNDPSAEA